MSAYARVKTANHELDKHSNRYLIERAIAYNQGTQNVKFIAATNEIKRALDEVKKFLVKNWTARLSLHHTALRGLELFTNLTIRYRVEDLNTKGHLIQ